MRQGKLIFRSGLAASSLVALGLVLSSCAQQGGVAAASTAADDVCRPQRLALDDSQQFFAGDIVKGALIGAVGGALSGFIFGGGGSQSVATGVIAGTAAGAFAGYWTSLQNQGGSHSDLISRMVGDMDREQTALDKAQTSFNQLVDCRKASARQVNADLKAGKLTREQAEVQMTQVRQLADQDIALAKRINARIDERTSNYVYATEQATGAPLAAAAAPAATASPSPPSAAPPRPAATQQASATTGDNAAVRQSASTLVQKKQTFAQSTDTAQQSLSSELQIAA
ncbi:MAG: hypothetical protein HYR63_25750 [Proteobacteria bacterium]|nr:hypothetical protein [Pseudomonadota bacterium]